VNLIAARQLAIYKFKKPFSNAESLSSTYNSRAQVVMKTLERHSKVFTASETGRNLLQQIVYEIQGGQMSMGVIQEQLESQDEYIMSQDPNSGLFQHVVKEGMSTTTKKILRDPGQCAGTLMQPGGM
jgi:hypothetical protein